MPSIALPSLGPGTAERGTEFAADAEPPRLPPRLQIDSIDDVVDGVIEQRDRIPEVSVVRRQLRRRTESHQNFSNVIESFFFFMNFNR